MASLCCLLALVLISLLCLPYLEAKRGKLLVSSQEDLELEKQLRILNKPAVKTVKDVGGDIFDCVDINKQPALDHPLLKNHKIQMPTPPTASSATTTRSKFPLQTLDCPQGTVPIKRIHKKDLIRAKASLPLSFHLSSNQQKNVEELGEYKAILESQTIEGYTYTKVQGSINLQNPKMEGDSDMSAALVSIEDGARQEPTYLQAGWLVAPHLFKDRMTRFFASWAHQKSGCFNPVCPGFIQTNHNYAIGQAFPNISIYNGPQFDVAISIHQDKETKNWKLTVLDPPIEMGYWPSSLIPPLQNGALVVVWGGIVRGVSNGKTPPMGNSLFPNKDGNFATSSYIMDLRVANQTNDDLAPDGAKMKIQEDRPQCYKVRNVGFRRQIGYSIQYGGPGGLWCLTNSVNSSFIMF